MRQTMVPMGFFFALEAFWLLLLARRVAPTLAWATFMVGLAYLFAMVATDSGARERPGVLGREPELG
jgi:hypothetical protein